MKKELGREAKRRTREEEWQTGREGVEEDRAGHRRGGFTGMGKTFQEVEGKTHAQH